MVIININDCVAIDDLLIIPLIIIVEIPEVDATIEIVKAFASLYPFILFFLIDKYAYKQPKAIKTISIATINNTTISRLIFINFGMLYSNKLKNKKIYPNIKIYDMKIFLKEDVFFITL